MPVIQTQEKTQEVMNTHVQYVVDTVEVEKSKIVEDTVQRMKPIIQKKISQVTKHIDFPQLQFLSKVVDMPVVGQRQASMVEKIQTTIHVPQAQVVEKTVEIPEIWTVWGTETSESLDTARTRQNDVRSKRQQHEQQHHSNQQQSTRQAMQQQTGEKERERGEREEREKGREAEKERDKEVKKDVTGWTVVTRSKKQRKRTIQIFVKVDGSMVTPMEVSLTDDKVEDVIRRILNGEDVYVTMHGRTIKRSEKLNCCGVSDGCTIQVMSRMRGGGREAQGKEEQGGKEASRKRKDTRTEVRGESKERQKSSDSGV